MGHLILGASVVIGYCLHFIYSAIHFIALIIPTNVITVVFPKCVKETRHPLPKPLLSSLYQLAVLSPWSIQHDGPLLQGHVIAQAVFQSLSQIIEFF